MGDEKKEENECPNSFCRICSLLIRWPAKKIILFRTDKFPGQTSSPLVCCKLSLLKYNQQTLSAKRKQVFSLDCWIWEEAQGVVRRGFIVRFSSGKLRITIIVGWLPATRIKWIDPTTPGRKFKQAQDARLNRFKSKESCCCCCSERTPHKKTSRHKSFNFFCLKLLDRHVIALYIYLSRILLETWCPA